MQSICEGLFGGLLKANKPCWSAEVDSTVSSGGKLVLVVVTVVRLTVAVAMDVLSMVVGGCRC